MQKVCKQRKKRNLIKKQKSCDRSFRNVLGINKLEGRSETQNMLAIVRREVQFWQLGTQTHSTSNTN